MIKGTFQPKDMLLAQWVHLRPRRGLAIVGILLIALACWASWISLFESHGSTHVWARWLPLAFLAYLAGMFWIWVPYRSNRSYKQRKDLHREVAFSLSDTGLMVQSENGQGVKPWSDYLKWKEGKQVFLLYLSDNLFQILPKHFFETEAELVQFRAMLQQKVSPSKG